MTISPAESAPSHNTNPSGSPASTAPLPPATTGRFRRRLWIATAVTLAVAFGIAVFPFGWIGSRFSCSETEDAFVEAHIVNVAPEVVSGHVSRFLVEENDQVVQG